MVRKEIRKIIANCEKQTRSVPKILIFILIKYINFILCSLKAEEEQKKGRRNTEKNKNKKAMAISDK